MSYFGEIKMFCGPSAVPGWLDCNGDVLPIAGHEGLFGAIGNRFGGDGTTTFALPDMRSRIPIHTPWAIGATRGMEDVTLDISHLPAHSHDAGANATATSNDPLGNVFADSTPSNWYTGDSPDRSMDTSCIAPAGGGLSHANRGPYLAVRILICDSGGQLPA